ncbi:hypothetical protein ACFY19_19810 [Streptosporangium saharense]|uniref:hypothetical protein n=1 Tax=Streptosporangium saharense TaxID=1706840 RepID=UPI00367C747B
MFARYRWRPRAMARWEKAQTMVGFVVVVGMVAFVALGALVWTVPVRGARPRPAAPWPVEAYALGTVPKDGELEIQHLRTTWPQAEEWAVTRSLAADVDEVYVRRNRTTWIWRNGEQIRKITRGGHGDAPHPVVARLAKDEHV